VDLTTVETRIRRSVPAPSLGRSSQELKRINVGGVEAGSTGTLATSWTQTLTRNETSGRHPSYTVVFTDQGFDPSASSIDGALKPTPRKR
jgi:hypothetical protein